MAKYLLQDIQGVMRGIRTIAKIGLQQQAEEISQRIGRSSFRPLAQSIFQSNKSSPLTSSSKPVKVSGIFPYVSYVFSFIFHHFFRDLMLRRWRLAPAPSCRECRNRWRMWRVCFASPASVLQFDNGFNLYSDKINTNTRASRDHPTTAVSSNGQGNDWPEGEAGEAAKRAEKFVSIRLIDWLIDRWLFKRLIHALIDWVIDWLIGGYSKDWSMHSIDWLIDWSAVIQETDPCIDWLIDWLSKERNYSRFWQFSERFLDRTLCACRNHQCEVTEILLTKITMFDNDEIFAWGPFQDWTKEKVS